MFWFFSWLLRDPNMKLRTTYSGYIDAVDSFFDQLLKRVAPHQVCHLLRKWSNLKTVLILLNLQGCTILGKSLMVVWSVINPCSLLLSFCHQYNHQSVYSNTVNPKFGVRNLPWLMRHAILWKTATFVLLCAAKSSSYLSSR